MQENKILAMYFNNRSISMMTVSLIDVVISEFHKTFPSAIPLEKAKVKAFVDKYFLEAGSDLESWQPTDWTPRSFLQTKFEVSSLFFGMNTWDLILKKSLQSVGS